jgi:exodeoxyribonuclease VII small subunit
MAKSKVDIEKLNYEGALNELKEILESLENQSLELEEILQYFERAKALLEHCQALLDKAELKVRELSGSDEVPAANEDEHALD